jgi:hypothetical protein
MPNVEITIPMALQLVIEDVGWWDKSHPVGPNAPFRSGLKRRHHPSDYLALVHLAKQLNMRPLIAFVACEWDRTNLLKKIPSATWMGNDWDNRHNVGPWLDQAAQTLIDHRNLLEIGLHGVGHEYWDRGRRSRTEFHNTQGEMRPMANINAHLEAFARILEDNGLGPPPQAFVPPGLNHSFGKGERGIQGILYKHGIRYVTTKLAKAKKIRQPQHPLMAWESGVLIIDRGTAPVPWYVIAAQPRFAFNRPVLSLHWANLLDEETQCNLEVVQRWVDFIKSGLDPMQQMLAPDTATCWTQFAYHTLSQIRQTGDGIAVDLRHLRELPQQALNNHFFFKIARSGEPAWWRVDGGQIMEMQNQSDNVKLITIRPDPGVDIIRLTPIWEPPARNVVKR